MNTNSTTNNKPRTLFDANPNIREQAVGQEQRFCALLLKDKNCLAGAIQCGITHHHFHDEFCQQFYDLQKRYYESHGSLLTSASYQDLLERAFPDPLKVARLKEFYHDIVAMSGRVKPDDFSILKSSILARHSQSHAFSIISNNYLALVQETGDPLKLIQKIKDDLANVNTSVTEKLPAINNLADFNLGDDNGGCLLGNRFLCRGADWLVAAPTGVGKSCWTMQGAVLWGLGRSFLGINPSGKLKSLIVQAENDAGDLSYMREGVFKFLRLPDDECREACQNIRIVCENATTGKAFIDLLDRILTKCHAEGFKPDLLYIDPLFGYLGDDVSNQAAVSAFIRTGMKPLIQKYNLGLIMLHHTNKPQKDGVRASGGDNAYLGSGSMELANAFRAVAGLVSVGEFGVSKFVIGKRGRLSGIVDEHNQPLNEFYIRWAEPQEGIGFHRDDNWMPTKKKATGPGADELLALVPMTYSIPSDKLEQSALGDGFSTRQYRKALNQLLADDRLFQTEVPRKGCRPAIHYSRNNPTPDNGTTTSNQGHVTTVINPVVTGTVTGNQNELPVTHCGERDAVVNGTPYSYRGAVNSIPSVDNLTGSVPGTLTGNDIGKQSLNESAPSTLFGDDDSQSSGGLF